MDLSKLTAAVLAVTLSVFPIMPAPAVAADTADTTTASASDDATTPEIPIASPTTAAAVEATTTAAATTVAATAATTVAAATDATKPAATETKAAETKPATTAATKLATTKAAATTTKAAETKPATTKPAATTTTIATTTSEPVTTTVTTEAPVKALKPVFKHFDKNLVNARVNITMPENATAELFVTFDSPECVAEPYYKADIAAGETVSLDLEGYDTVDPKTDFRSYKAAVKVKGGQYDTVYTYTTAPMTVPDPNDHPDSFIEMNLVISVDGEMSAKTETVTVDGNTCYIALHLDGYVKGDVNGDGIIDSNDASLVLEEYALASTGAAGKFGQREMMAGDINADGIIGSDDASSILAYYAAASTGGNPTWN
ncbi:MAG: hypothetical protein J5501_05740 [Ruminococcus sp.]|nr:hypothetical protein [Ruminococcus sp.]